jgi:hypothetical protein
MGEVSLVNQTLVDQIVDAVLYEGYILYPYRPSIKNRQRWTFGALYPRAYCEAAATGDAWSMQTECLVRGGSDAVIQINVRFLHLQERRVGQLDCRISELAQSDEPVFHFVENLKVDDRLLQTWQEAVQRDVVLDELDVGSLLSRPQNCEFAFAASQQVEPVRNHAGEIEAILMREQQALAGGVEASALPVGERLYRLRVTVENHTSLECAGQVPRDRAVRHSLASTHTILGTRNGEFCSMIDPPADCSALVAACRNEGTWPVLVGLNGEKDTVLSSPITLYDYPQIAPESPGEFFDGTEMDEMLVLRVLTLTDDERSAVAAVDERARALLARTSSMSQEQMMGLHGTVRGMRLVSTGESQ